MRHCEGKLPGKLLPARSVRHILTLPKEGGTPDRSPFAGVHLPASIRRHLYRKPTTETASPFLIVVHSRAAFVRQKRHEPLCDAEKCTLRGSHRLGH